MSDIEQKVEDFENLISKKYEKKYHLIDKPELSFKLAQKSCQSINLGKFKKSTPQSIMALKRSKKQWVSYKKNENPQREDYLKLKQNMKRILIDLDKSSEKTLNISQFFQYKQLILKGFFVKIFEDVKKQCKQKGELLIDIWNELTSLTGKILEIFQNYQYSCEKQHLSDNIMMQNEYCSIIEAYQQKFQKLKIHAQKMERVVQYMTHQLRLKKKQVKKIYHDNYNLLNTVNDYKEKKAEIELQYIDLMMNYRNMTEQEGKLMLKRKQQIFQQKKQILKLKNNRKKNLKNHNHEIKIEGKINIKKFLDEITKNIDLNDPKFENKISETIDNKLEQKQQIFEENAFRLQKIKKQNMADQFKTYSTQTHYFDFEKSDGQTQTYTLDKIQAFMINCIPTQTERHVKKKILKIDVGSQFEKTVQSWANPQVKRYKTVQFSYIGFDSEEKLQFRLSDKNESEKMKDKDYLEIKYYEKHYRNGRNSKNYETKQTQTQEFMFSNKRIREELFERRQGKIFKKSRFNHTQFGEKFRAISSQIPNQIDKKRRNSGNQNLKKNKKFNSVAPQNRYEGRKNIHKILQGNDELFTSLSRKGKVCNRKQFLESLNKKDKKKIKDGELEVEVEVFDMQRDEIKQLLDNIQFSSSSDSNSSNQSSQNKRNEFKFLNKENRRQTMQKIQILSPEDKKQFISIEQKTESVQIRQEDAFIDEAWKEKLIKFCENPIFCQRRQRQSRIITDSMVKNYIEKCVKKKKYVKKKISEIYLSNSENSNIQNSMHPIILDVKKKMKEGTFLTKKLVLPNKMSNLFYILSAAYGKAYDFIHHNEPLENFILPLYETLSIFYGAINKSELYKKMINFIAQLCLQIENKICQSFLFFLNLDEKNPMTEKVTTYDCYLYLKLLQALCLNGTPVTDLQHVYTTADKVHEVLRKVLCDENLPEELQNLIISKFNNKLEYLEKEQNQKLDVYSCCLTIISDIIQAKESVNESFSRIFDMLQSLQSNDRVNLGHLKFFTIISFTTKVEQVMFIKRIEEISQPLKLEQTKEKYLTKNQASSYIIRIGIFQFTELYKKILRKYQINSAQKLENLRQLGSNCDKRHSELQKVMKTLNQAPIRSEQLTKKSLNEQLKDLVHLNHVQRQAALTFEKTVGKNIIILYSFSIIYLNKSKQSNLT